MDKVVTKITIKISICSSNKYIDLFYKCIQFELIYYNKYKLFVGLHCYLYIKP